MHSTRGHARIAKLFAPCFLVALLILFLLTFLVAVRADCLIPECSCAGGYTVTDIANLTIDDFDAPASQARFFAMEPGDASYTEYTTPGIALTGSGQTTFRDGKDHWITWVRFDEAEGTGVIFEAGAGGDGLWIGQIGYRMEFSAGEGKDAESTGDCVRDNNNNEMAWCCIDLTPYLNSEVYLLEFTADTDTETIILRLDGVELCRDTAAGGMGGTSADYAGSNAAGFGIGASNVVTGMSLAAFPGALGHLLYYNNKAYTDPSPAVQFPTTSYTGTHSLQTWSPEITSTKWYSPDGSYMFDVWVYLTDNTGVARWLFMFSSYYETAGTPDTLVWIETFVRIESDETIALITREGSNTNIETIYSSALQVQTWTRVTGTLNSSSIALWVDGTFVGSTAITFTVESSYIWLQTFTTQRSVYLDHLRFLPRTMDAHEFMYPCTNVDECALETDNCDATNAECSDTPGSFTCACNTGWETSDAGITCTNVDECTLETDNCDATNAECSDTPGSFTCACNAGWETSDAGVTCTNTDECTLETDNCDSANAQCLDTPGSFTCSCNAGWDSLDAGVTCTNFDECVLETDDCDAANARCSDTPGSFTCTCNTGWDSANEGVTCTNIDECALEGDDCDTTNAQCSDTPGSFTCTCNAGWETADAGVTCTNFDECVLETDDCDAANARCSDTPGSFTCTCNAGWNTTDAGVTCTNIDECALEADNCDAANAQCSDTLGSFTCSCNTGWGTVDAGVTCTNTDECALDTDNCDATNAVCVDTPGSFACTCNEGWGTVDQGITCTDLDECTLAADNCDSSAACSNTIGSFTCTCNLGWSGTGTSCSDDDECVLGTHNCAGTEYVCTNSIGSFVCSCNIGYHVQECTDRCPGYEFDAALGVESPVKVTSRALCPQCHSGFMYEFNDVGSRGAYFDVPNLVLGTECTVSLRLYSRVGGGRTTVFVLDGELGRHRLSASTGSPHTIGTQSIAASLPEVSIGISDTDVPLVNFQWMHVAVLFSPNQTVTYAEGTLSPPNPCYFNGGTIPQTVFGTDHDSSARDFDGYLADITIHDRLLSLGELQSITNFSRPAEPSAVLEQRYNMFCTTGCATVTDPTCIDRDECADGLDNCDAKGTMCVNTDGSFECIDLDECDYGLHNCNTEDSVCVNTAGSFECQCQVGYSTDVDGVTCIECPANFYCPENSTVPTPCGTGATSPAASASIGDCRCVPGYAYVGHTIGPCQPCPRGTYCPDVHTLVPLRCPANTYSNVLASTSNATCTVCPFDYISKPGAGLLSDCQSSPSLWTTTAKTNVFTQSADPVGGVDFTPGAPGVANYGWLTQLVSIPDTNSFFAPMLNDWMNDGRGRIVRVNMATEYLDSVPCAMDIPSLGDFQPFSMASLPGEMTYVVSSVEHYYLARYTYNATGDNFNCELIFGDGTAPTGTTADDGCNADAKVYRGERDRDYSDITLRVVANTDFTGMFYLKETDGTFQRIRLLELNDTHLCATTLWSKSGSTNFDAVTYDGGFINTWYHYLTPMRREYLISELDIYNPGDYSSLDEDNVEFVNDDADLRSANDAVCGWNALICVFSSWRLWVFDKGTEDFTSYFNDGNNNLVISSLAFSATDSFNLYYHDFSVSSGYDIFGYSGHIGTLEITYGPCPPGHEPSRDPEGEARDITCFPCMQGKFKNDTSFDPCVPCPRGTWMNSTGASACFGCPTGFTTEALQSATELSNCTLCDRGYVGPVSGPCVACPTGKYKPEVGAGTCRDCFIGTYCPEASPQIYRCPDDTYSYLNASGTRDNCLPCPPGTAIAGGGRWITDCQPEAYNPLGISGETIYAQFSAPEGFNSIAVVTNGTSGDADRGTISFGWFPLLVHGNFESPSIEQQAVGSGHDDVLPQTVSGFGLSEPSQIVQLVGSHATGEFYLTDDQVAYVWRCAFDYATTTVTACTTELGDGTSGRRDGCGSNARVYPGATGAPHDTDASKFYLLESYTLYATSGVAVREVTVLENGTLCVATLTEPDDDGMPTGVFFQHGYLFFYTLHADETRVWWVDTYAAEIDYNIWYTIPGQYYDPPQLLFARYALTSNLYTVHAWDIRQAEMLALASFTTPPLDANYRTRFTAWRTPDPNGLPTDPNTGRDLYLVQESSGLYQKVRRVELTYECAEREWRFGQGRNVTCLQCTICPHGYYTQVDCNRYADTICNLCPPSTIWNGTNQTCEPCPPPLNVWEYTVSHNYTTCDVACHAGASKQTVAHSLLERAASRVHYPLNISEVRPGRDVCLPNPRPIDTRDSFALDVLQVTGDAWILNATLHKDEFEGVVAFATNQYFDLFQTLLDGSNHPCATDYSFCCLSSFAQRYVVGAQLLSLGTRDASACASDPTILDWILEHQRGGQITDSVVTWNTTWSSDARTGTALITIPFDTIHESPVPYCTVDGITTTCRMGLGVVFAHHAHSAQWNQSLMLPTVQQREVVFHYSAQVTFVLTSHQRRSCVETADVTLYRADGGLLRMALDILLHEQDGALAANTSLASTSITIATGPRGNLGVPYTPPGASAALTGRLLSVTAHLNVSLNATQDPTHWYHAYFPLRTGSCAEEVNLAGPIAYIVEGITEEDTATRRGATYPNLEAWAAYGMTGRFYTVTTADSWAWAAPTVSNRGASLAALVVATPEGRNASRLETLMLLQIRGSASQDVVAAAAGANVQTEAAMRAVCAQHPRDCLFGIGIVEGIPVARGWLRIDAEVCDTASPEYEATHTFARAATGRTSTRGYLQVTQYLATLCNFAQPRGAAVHIVRARQPPWPALATAPDYLVIAAKATERGAAA